MCQLRRAQPGAGRKARARLRPVCGRCKQRLSGIKPVTVTDATFNEVERSPLPVLLDVWAPWCGPCRYLAPVMDELATELAGRILVAKLNADESPATASRFNIQSIPTVLVFHGGKEVDRIVGVPTQVGNRASPDAGIDLIASPGDASPDQGRSVNYGLQHVTGAGARMKETVH
jgi:thioredoxin 2